ACSSDVCSSDPLMLRTAAGQALFSQLSDTEPPMLHSRGLPLHQFEQRSGGVHVLTATPQRHLPAGNLNLRELRMIPGGATMQTARTNPDMRRTPPGLLPAPLPVLTLTVQCVASALVADCFGVFTSFKFG